MRREAEMEIAKVSALVSIMIGLAGAITGFPAALAKQPAGRGTKFVYNEGFPISGARAARLQECVKLERRYLQRQWGVRTNTIYGACMAEGGQTE